MKQSIAQRFPGATFLSKAEFASTIVGGSFRYREFGSELLIKSPAESFFGNGQYSVGHRAIFSGTYSYKRGIVSIKCVDCHATFLGLGKKRVFFRHEGRLLMANADGNGSAIELI